MTDQDHALVFTSPDVPADEADAYFERLARRVTDGLVEAGIPRCRGGVMAESAAWRADRETWTQTFREQLALSDVGGTAFSNIALDYRRVAGGLDIESTIDQLVRKAAAEGWLVRKLASSALDLRPPTGFFREFLVGWDGSRAGTLDVKHGGITPITNLARTFAVASGVASNRTIDRLRAASSLGGLDPDLAAGLEEAFRLLWRIRLRHQVEPAPRGRSRGRSGRSPPPRPADPEEPAGGVQADHRRSTCALDHLRPAPPMNARPARPRGLGGRPWREASYASLDFETTGLDLDGDDIISFGVVPIERGQDPPGAVDLPRGPARPTAEARVDRGARAATGGPGRGVCPLRRSWPTSVTPWRDGTCSLGPPRSKRRSSRGCSGLGQSWWRKQIIDVLRLALLVERTGTGRQRDFSLTAVADRLGVPVERPHHALDDALTTAQVFLVLQPELERRGITTPRRLLRASRG